MGIFNAISGTPTSAHSSTTVLWKKQTRAFISTKHWLNLQIQPIWTHSNTTWSHHPLFFVSCFRCHELLSVGPLFLFPMETPVNTVGFQALRVLSTYCQIWVIYLLVILFLILWKMGQSTWWFSKCVSHTVTDNTMLSLVSGHVKPHPRETIHRLKQTHRTSVFAFVPSLNLIGTIPLLPHLFLTVGLPFMYSVCKRVFQGSFWWINE